MNGELTLSIAGGIVLAVGALWLLNTLVEIPKALRRRKERREMFEFMDKSVNDLMQHIKNDVANRKVDNAKYSSQKAKTSTRSKSTAGTKKATVQKAKKGVSNGNKR